MKFDWAVKYLLDKDIIQEARRQSNYLPESIMWPQGEGIATLLECLADEVEKARTPAPTPPAEISVSRNDAERKE